MDHLNQEINFDNAALHARLIRAWLHKPGIGQGELAKLIGISHFALRSFLMKKEMNFRMPTKIKIVAWIESVEKDMDKIKENNDPQ